MFHTWRRNLSLSIFLFYFSANSLQSLLATSHKLEAHLCRQRWEGILEKRGMDMSSFVSSVMEKIIPDVTSWIKQDNAPIFCTRNVVGQQMARHTFPYVKKLVWEWDSMFYILGIIDYPFTLPFSSTTSPSSLFPSSLLPFPSSSLCPLPHLHILPHPHLHILLHPLTLSIDTSCPGRTGPTWGLGSEGRCLLGAVFPRRWQGETNTGNLTMVHEPTISCVPSVGSAD